VLLDEVEKSHPDVQEIFYQVFDKGMLQDDKGEEINFKNTIIILTSNVGTDTIMKVCADPDTMPDSAGLAEALRPDLLKVFKPALLGRMSIVPYFPLSDPIIRQIIRLKLGQIKSRVKEHYKAECDLDGVVETIASRCKEVESGARNIDNILSGTLLPEMSFQVLDRLSRGEPITKVKASVEGDKFKYHIE
jgi:type VI secretion system protein VasG